MKIEISIGIESEKILFVIGQISYVRVGEVAELDFFKLVPYQKVGSVYRVFGITYNAIKKEIDD